MANSDLSRSSSMALPRVLIVSRRALRKNKFVDFVGEYHLDLIVRFGAVPVIVPRVPKIDTLLQSFEPFHGLLLCEGEDVDPSLYNAQPSSTLSTQQLDHIRKLHPSDTSIDKHKDSVELNLTKLCLQRNIPILGICRGSQILNVSCEGTLYQDVEMEMMFNGCDSDDGFERVCHINYEDYDGHRHLVRVIEDCPLGVWFNDSMKENGGMEIMVNSYHHQGVKRLAQRFVPMAFSPDGLIEGFYDPQVYDPEEGKFIVGLQFHPERMRQPDSNDFDYPGCPMVYQEFVKAVIAHEKKLSCSAFVPRAPNPSEELELKRRIIMKSLSVAINVHRCGCEMVTNQHPQLEPREDFLDVYHMEKSLENTALSLQQEKRLKQVGETVKNGSEYTQKMKMMQEKEKVASNMMENMSIEQLSELMSFYQLMGHLCSETLERKLNELLLQE